MLLAAALPLPMPAIGWAPRSPDCPYPPAEPSQPSSTAAVTPASCGGKSPRHQCRPVASFGPADRLSWDCLSYRTPKQEAIALFTGPLMTHQRRLLLASVRSVP